MTQFPEPTLERCPARARGGNAVTRARADSVEKRPRSGPPDLRVFDIPQPAPPVAQARARGGPILSLSLIVLLPLAAFAAYLWLCAEDRYASTAGFTVRSEDAVSPQDLLGGLAQFTGQGGGSDGDILYAFIQSQEMAQAVDRELNLRAHYSESWPRDWMFSLWPDASTEALMWYWNRVVRVAYDQATGLIEVRVLAFDPDFAQAVAEQVVAQSRSRINALSAQARDDAIGYAQKDLKLAVDRLRMARVALTGFRLRTQIVDPAADLRSRMGVMTKLQEQLAAKLIEYDALRGTTRPDDPRLTQARHMLRVIRDRIAEERLAFASDSTETGTVGKNYPELIAEYQSLAVDQEFAEESYRAALAALDIARAEAARQSRYLAIYIRPTLAYSSEYPSRLVLTGLAAVFLFLLWLVLSLVYSSLRDRR